MFQTYSPSGRFSPSFSVWLILGLVAMTLVATLYALGLRWISIPHITFLLTIALGWSAGRIGQWIVKQGKIRNVTLAFVVAILLSIGGLAAKFAYQYFEDYREEMQLVESMQIHDVTDDEGNRPDEEAFALFKEEFKLAARDTFTFAKHIERRTDRGWNLGKAGRKGLRIQGPLVWLVWLVEAGIVLFFCVPGVLTAARKPFAEQLDAWADETEVVMVLPVSNDEMVHQIKAASSVQQLLELPIPKTDQSNQFAIYTVHSIPGHDLEDAYLTVELHEYSLDSEGNTETSVKPLATKVVITSEQRLQLKENSELMKEAIAAYRASLAEESSREPAEDDGT